MGQISKTLKIKNYCDRLGETVSKTYQHTEVMTVSGNPLIAQRPIKCSKSVICGQTNCQFINGKTRY